MATRCNLEEMDALYWLVGCILKGWQWKADRHRALATLITASFFLGSGIAGLKNRLYPTDFDSLVKMGFGTVHPKSFVSFITASVSVSEILLGLSS